MCVGVNNRKNGSGRGGCALLKNTRIQKIQADTTDLKVKQTQNGGCKFTRPDLLAVS
jgi:hypothetical protein